MTHYHVINRYSRFLLLGLLLLLIGACASPPEFDSVYTRITEGTLQAGDEIPQPEEDVILTVIGLIGSPNSEEGIQMDLATMEAVGLVEYSLKDPFEKEEATFRGVLMRDLLDLWQVDESATTLQILALNDYQIEVPIDLLRDYPVLFALQQNGEYMTADYRGPAILVFPYQDYEFERPATDSYWIWQIKAIKVK